MVTAPAQAAAAAMVHHLAAITVHQMRPQSQLASHHQDQDHQDHCTTTTRHTTPMTTTQPITIWTLTMIVHTVVTTMPQDHTTIMADHRTFQTATWTHHHQPTHNHHHIHTQCCRHQAAAVIAQVS